MNTSKSKKLAAPEPPFPNPGESEIELPAMKGGSSRRKAIKQALLAGAGVAIGGNIPGVLAGNPASTPDVQNRSALIPQVVAAVPTPPTAGTSYIMLTGVDFRPLFGDTVCAFLNYCGIYATSNFGTLLTTLNLPQNARITEIEFYAVHNVAGTTFFQFNRTDTFGGSGANRASNSYTMLNSGVAAIPLTIPKNLELVDNTSFKFILTWSPNSNGASEMLFGARVGYVGGLGRFGANT